MDRNDLTRDMRGQMLSVMMVLGFLILFSFLILFFAVGTVSQPPVSFDRESIQDYLETCLETVGEQGLVKIGRQGGVALLDQYHAGEAFGIEYSLLNGADRAPSKEKLEGQLSFYVREDLDSCLDDFEAFKAQGWQVSEGALAIDTAINRNDVTLTANLPLRVSQNQQQLSIDQFSVTLPVRLDLIQQTVQAVVEFTQSNPDAVDMSRLNASTLNATVFPHEQALIYVFMDEQSRIDGEPYRFYTALR